MHSAIILWSLVAGAADPHRGRQAGACAANLDQDAKWKREHAEDLFLQFQHGICWILPIYRVRRSPRLRLEGLVNSIYTAGDTK